MTTTITLREGTATVFVALDHATAECVGIHAAKSGNRFEALEPICQGIRGHVGGYAAEIATGLSLRQDHGSAFRSNVFQNKRRSLGIESSPTFVREPEGNGWAERFIRTIKKNLLWVYSFDTIERLRADLELKLKKWV